MRVVRLAKLKHKYIRENVMKQQAGGKFFLFLIFFLYFNVLLFFENLFLILFTILSSPANIFVILGQRFCHPRRDGDLIAKKSPRKNRVAAT